MPRIARIVTAHYPHHIIQRGNRKQEVFFREEDYQEYLNLLQRYSRQFRLKILSYCLMPNHVHLIAIPEKDTILAQAIGETHRNYTRYINFREGWRGYLWQGRFASYVLDERYLLAATRYILLNPVKAGITKKAWDYKWSSAQYHIGKEKNCLIDDTLLKDLINNWKDFLSMDVSNNELQILKMHERTGRPLGDINFIGKLENILKINLKRKKPGPKGPKRKKGDNN